MKILIDQMQNKFDNLSKFYKQKIFSQLLKFSSFDYLKEVLDNKEDYIGKQATIRYFQLTPDGIPRFPFAVGFRDYE